MNHRKFLKKSIPYRIGEELGSIFPDEYKITEHESLKLKEFYGNNTVLFFLSTRCNACNYDEVLDFMRSYKKFTYILLIDGRYEDYKKISEKFRGYKVFNCNMEIISNDFSKLKVEVIPWVIGINSIGQIICGGAFITCSDIINQIKVMVEVHEYHYPEQRIEA